MKHIDKYKQWQDYPYMCPKCGDLTRDNVLNYQSWSRWFEICKLCKEFSGVNMEVREKTIEDLEK